MSLNLLREMREALHEFNQAYRYVCELHEAGLETPAEAPRPSKMDPHKASAAANLVSKNHGDRNKHTVMAHSAAANAHSTAARDAEAAGKGHLASAHKKAMGYHMNHQHGPKPVAPSNAPMNIKAATKPVGKPAMKAAAPAIESKSSSRRMVMEKEAADDLDADADADEPKTRKLGDYVKSGVSKASPERVQQFKDKMVGHKARAFAQKDAYDKEATKTKSGAAWARDPSDANAKTKSLSGKAKLADKRAAKAVNAASAVDVALKDKKRDAHYAAKGEYSPTIESDEVQQEVSQDWVTNKVKSGAAKASPERVANFTSKMGATVDRNFSGGNTKIRDKAIDANDAITKDPSLAKKAMAGFAKKKAMAGGMVSSAKPVQQEVSADWIKNKVNNGVAKSPDGGESFRKKMMGKEASAGAAAGAARQAAYKPAAGGAQPQPAVDHAAKLKSANSSFRASNKAGIAADQVRKAQAKDPAALKRGATALGK